MVAMGVSYQGMQLCRGEEIIGHWASYEIPVEAKLAMQESPGSRLVRVFGGEKSNARSIASMVRPLEGCSPEMFRAIFENLSSEDALHTMSGEDIGPEEDGEIPPLTDEQLACSSCGHVGLQRAKEWPALCLEATEAIECNGAPPASRIKSLVREVLVCPHCDRSVERPSFSAEKTRALALLISERLQLSMPVAAKDLREFLQSQQKCIFSTAELLWASIEDYLIDMGEAFEGVSDRPIEKFVVESDSPKWVHVAMVQLESMGWIENIQGEIFEKVSHEKTSQDFFSEPLIEHQSFPINLAH